VSYNFAFPSAIPAPSTPHNNFFLPISRVKYLPYSTDSAYVPDQTNSHKPSHHTSLKRYQADNPEYTTHPPISPHEARISRINPRIFSGISLSCASETLPELRNESPDKCSVYSAKSGNSFYNTGIAASG
jgi:hypothetical protein